MIDLLRYWVFKMRQQAMRGVCCAPLFSCDWLFCFCCSVAQCPTLWDPMGCSTPGFRVLHHLLELTQTDVHWVGDAIQPSHPLSSPSPPAFSLSQHQGLSQLVGSSYHQAPLSMEFSRQEYWSGLPFPTPGSLSDSGIQPMSLASPALSGRFFYCWPTWESQGMGVTVFKLDA